MDPKTEFTLNQPHQGAWLLYLNGIEIPAIQASVNYGVWSPPTASFALAPHPLLNRLGAEDRVDVTIFFLDTLTDPNKPEFRLLFEGEIVGWSYQSAFGKRAQNFECIGDIGLFSQLYFFFIDSVDTAVTAATGHTDDTSFQSAGLFYPFSLFQQNLGRQLDAEGNPIADEAAGSVKRPFDLIYNIVRSMLDMRVPGERRTLPASNFFARWARKRNFLNRFVALPMFEDGNNEEEGIFPMFKQVGASAALTAVRQGLMSASGDQGTIMGVIQQLLMTAQMELAMIPTAPCQRVRLTDGAILGPSTTPPNSNAPYTEPLRLANYFVKPPLSFGIPPACNVVFPSMTANTQYQENYVQQPTRMYLNDSLMTTALSLDDGIPANALRVGYPPEVNTVFRQAAGQENQSSEDSARRIQHNGKNVLVYPEEFFKGPIVAKDALPTWFQLLMTHAKTEYEKMDPNKRGLKEPELFELFELYTENEYYRQRYTKRGGAVDMAFNPFIVPGFPCAVFDDRSTAFDVLGYVTNVSQLLSVGQMRTSIAYTAGRTFSEMFTLLKDELARSKAAFGSAPLEPVKEIRYIIQDFDNAERFYNALFFGRVPTPGKKASFDFREIVGYGSLEDPYGDVETIVIDGPSVQMRDAASAAGQELYDLEHKADVALKAYQEARTEEKAAQMRYQQAYAAAQESQGRGMFKELVKDRDQAQADWKRWGAVAATRQTELDAARAALEAADGDAKSEDKLAFLQLKNREIYTETKERNAQLNGEIATLQASIADVRVRLELLRPQYEEAKAAYDKWEAEYNRLRQIEISQGAGSMTDPYDTGIAYAPIQTADRLRKENKEVLDPLAKQFDDLNALLKEKTAALEAMQQQYDNNRAWMEANPDAGDTHEKAGQAPTTNVAGDLILQPLEGARDLFDSYDAAMRYASRPICSLTEYLQFIHGGLSIETLKQPRVIDGVTYEPQVEGEHNEFGYVGAHGAVRTSAVYFDRIRRLRQGPGERPSPEQIGVIADGTELRQTGNFKGVDRHFPQTRANWDRVLLQYRRIVRDSLAPQK